MHFLFTLNDAYACHLAATLASILRSHSSDTQLEFHIITSDFSEETKNNILHLKNIRDFNVFFYSESDLNVDLSEFKITMPHITIETYYRLFAHEALKNINKVIHLDVDLLVLKNLKDLWNIDLGEHYMTGSPCPKVTANYLRPLGFNPDKHTYYQAGANVLNLKLFRENNVTQDVLKIVQDYMPILQRQDQDLLNIIAKGRVLNTSISYNFTTVFIEDKATKKKFKHSQDYLNAKKSPHIVHFSRPLKPWHNLSTHPYKKEYWACLNLTPWKDNTPQAYPLKKLILNKLKSFFIGTYHLCSSTQASKIFSPLINTLYYSLIINKLNTNIKKKFTQLSDGMLIKTIVKNSNPRFLYFERMTKLIITKNTAKCDACLIWGTRFSGRNFICLLQAYLYSKPIIIAEDGFIRSIDIGEKYAPGLSCILDTQGIYYDYRQMSSLDRFLNSDWKITAEQEAAAQSSIELIIQHKISKYNLVPAKELNFDPDNQYDKIVIVIDQRKGDQSIPAAGANAQTFAKMLQDAVTDNPNSLILIKTHPDEMHGGFKGYFSSYKPDRDNVRIISETLNPISLMQAVDSVYVVSSQMGAEALICGNDVTCYGAPVYSGWGLTNDKGPNRVRKKNRTLHEVFYGLYLKHAYYYAPTDPPSCDLNSTIAYLSSQMESSINGS